MKKFYASKTLWANVIGLGAIIAQIATGKEVIDPEAQMAILAAINVVLRFITKEPIVW